MRGENDEESACKSVFRRARALPESGATVLRGLRGVCITVLWRGGSFLRPPPTIALSLPPFAEPAWLGFFMCGQHAAADRLALEAPEEVAILWGARNARGQG